MTQNEAILKHLKEKGSITPLEALELYGCFRLSARIHNLREKHNIKMVLVENGKNKFAKYVLRED